MRSLITSTSAIHSGGEDYLSMLTQGCSIEQVFIFFVSYYFKRQHQMVTAKVKHKSSLDN